MAQDDAPIRSILLPTDGSDDVKHAIRRGISLARVLGSSVTALYVTDTTRFATVPGIDWAIVNEALEREGERALDAVAVEARREGVAFVQKRVDGHPSEAILEEARDHDLVIMGTLGRTGLAHLLLGSVAERVIRHAPCPVMVVRAPSRRESSARTAT